MGLPHNTPAQNMWLLLLHLLCVIQQTCSKVAHTESESPSIMTGNFGDFS
jgi:hypothetical protein